MFTMTFQAKVSGQLVEQGLQFSARSRERRVLRMRLDHSNGTKMIDWDVAP